MLALRNIVQDQRILSFLFQNNQADFSFIAANIQAAQDAIDQQMKQPQRQKTDAMFKHFDLNNNGSLDIAEVWKIVAATNAISESDAQQALTQEAWTAQIMPALGGGTDMDIDQWHRAYTELQIGDLDVDFACVMMNNPTLMKK